jgi:hypothetical protein
LGFFTTANGYSSAAGGVKTQASGEYSTAMGSCVSTNGMNGSFIIGDGTSRTTFSSAQNQMTMRFQGAFRLFAHDTTVGVWLNGNSNSWSTISDSTKKERFLRADGESFLGGLSKLRLMEL